LTEHESTAILAPEAMAMNDKDSEASAAKAKSIVPRGDWEARAASALGRFCQSVESSMGALNIAFLLYVSFGDFEFQKHGLDKAGVYFGSFMLIHMVLFFFRVAAWSTGKGLARSSAAPELFGRAQFKHAWLALVSVFLALVAGSVAIGAAAEKAYPQCLGLGTSCAMLEAQKAAAR
jgi:hypothetical protein